MRSNRTWQIEASGDGKTTEQANAINITKSLRTVPCLSEAIESFPLHLKFPTPARTHSQNPLITEHVDDHSFSQKVLRGNVAAKNQQGSTRKEMAADWRPSSPVPPGNTGNAMEFLPHGIRNSRQSMWRPV